MTAVADAVAAVCLVLGAALALVAAVGLLRLPDVLARMHAATKPQTLGLLLLLVGLALGLRDPLVVTTAVLVGGFQLATIPVAAHMLGRAAYRLGRVRSDVLLVDELGDELDRLRRGGIDLRPGPAALLDRAEGTGVPERTEPRDDPNAPAVDAFGPATADELGLGETRTLDGTLADPLDRPPENDPPQER